MYIFANSLYFYTFMNKIERLLEIRKILDENRISNQDELLEQLVHRGITVTQATLSRDLKYLRVGKRPDPEKGSVYYLSDLSEKDQTEHTHMYPLSEPEGFISIDFSFIYAVIKTLPGHASALAYKIDHLNAFEILGTIAGDDTILVITREGVPRPTLIDCLRKVIPV